MVIGGTGGIGSAACIQLAKDGFDVAIHYFKNKSKAGKLKNELEKIGSKVVVVSGDIFSIQHVQEIKDKSQRAIGKNICYCQLFNYSGSKYQV